MGSKQHCFPTCSCPFSLTAVAILVCWSTPDPSQLHQSRLVDRHTWQPVWGEGLWGMGEAPIGPSNPFPLLVPSTMEGRIATNHAMGLSSDPGVSTSLEGDRDIRTFSGTWSWRLKSDLLSLFRGEHWWCGLLPL